MERNKKVEPQSVKYIFREKNQEQLNLLCTG